MPPATHEFLISNAAIGGSQSAKVLTERVVGDVRWQYAFVRVPRRERGQDVVEYGIIIATIAVVVLLGVTTFGKEITPWFAQLAGHITTVGT
jgi:Flp pilus assembly pilin Flp